MGEATGKPEVSVVVTVAERHDDMRLLYKLYASELERLGKSFEFLFVVAGDFERATADIGELKHEDDRVRLIRLPGRLGEAGALMEGFRSARADTVLTLASYVQVEPRDLEKVFAAYERGSDLVVTRRYPRKDHFANRLQSVVYHLVIRVLTGARFRDITCGLRLINKRITSRLVLYGDLHRFIPVFALARGIRVEEVKVAQREEDTRVRLVTPGTYLRRILDIVTIFFLVKFTRKPLRFFGLVGFSLFLPGLLLTVYLGAMRLVGATGLADRPLLLLGILLMVFGVQVFSMGLVGELIIFSHVKDMEDYVVEERIE
jgi:glycosyltransferase involved in cell wall biosynthesis